MRHRPSASIAVLCLSICFTSVSQVVADNNDSDVPADLPTESKYYFNEFDAVEAEQIAQTTTLKFVHILFRHGDRTPSVFIPNDPNTADKWKEGAGELTIKGIQQQYRLGKWLRRRYDGFLGSEFHRKDVIIRSSDYPRTLMSAQANLAGLFPPSDHEKLSEELPWRPLPVHTVPQHDDFLLNEQAKCPAAKTAADSMTADPRVQEIERDHKQLLTYIGEQSGLKKPFRLRDMWSIFDPLNCEFHHQDTHPWPSWVNETMWRKVQQLYDESAQFLFHMPTLKRLRGGPLIDEIFGRLARKANGTEDPTKDPKKMYIYSAHDTTLAALLAAMGAVPKVFPLYATAVMVELHLVNGKHFVQVFYKNVTDVDSVFRVNLPGCSEPCELDVLHGLLKGVIPNDWHSECGLATSAHSQESLVLWILLIVISITACLLLIFILVMEFVVWRGKSKKNRAGQVTRMNLQPADSSRQKLMTTDEEDDEEEVAV